MKFIIIVISIGFLSLSCQSTSKPIGAKKEMRHGWVIFSGPPKTKVAKVSSEETLSKGKTLYQKHCLKCHGESGKGDGPKAKILELKPANLAAISKLHPSHYLVIQINQGRGDMPQWQDYLTPKETYQLTEYIKTFKKK